MKNTVEGFLRVSRRLLQDAGIPDKEFTYLISVRIISISRPGWKLNGREVNKGAYVIINTNNRTLEDDHDYLVTVDGTKSVRKYRISDSGNIGWLMLSSCIKADLSAIAIHPVEDLNKDWVVGEAIHCFPNPVN